MKTLKGKYTDAIIFTNNIEKEALDQIQTMIDLPSSAGSKVRIMPDTHAGAGCTIGTTMTLTDKVVPNFVGVDIGCGVLAVQIKDKDIDLSKLDEVINERIPSGFDIHTDPVSHCHNINDLIANADIDNAQKSLGTLGGGNHFIEVDVNDNGFHFLVIHTGSRHLGLEVCKYYQNKAEMNVRKSSKETKELIEKLKKEGRQKDIQSELAKLKENGPSLPKELCHIEGKDFGDYIHDMKLCQEYAAINRQTIAQQIIIGMGFSVGYQFDTIHNYIDTDDMILRKGAIAANLNQRVIIPMNMRDGSLICIGKGTPNWNWSAPHGAGRLMSRATARKRLSLDDFKESMKDIYSTSVNADTIDEAPMVYKPAKEIMKNIKDTIEIEQIIRPIYNFKAH